MAIDRERGARQRSCSGAKDRQFHPGVAKVTLALFAIAAEGGATAATPGPFDFAVYATGSDCGAITISGNAYTDSFDSSQGSYSQTKQNSKGLIGASGNISLSGTVIINGPIFALNTTVGPCKNGTPGITLAGKAQVTGGYFQLNAAPIFAAVPVTPPGTTDVRLTASAILPPGSYGNISVSSRATLTLSPGTYNINSIALSGQSILAVNPAGQVVINIAGNNVAQPIQVSGGGVVNPSGVPLNIQLVYGGALPILISSGSASFGVIYAPNAPVTLSDGAEWYGAMVVKSLDDSDGGSIHYDRSLAVPPTITGSIAPAPNTKGWNNSNVTVTFACADPILGIASCSGPVAVTTEGANQVVPGTSVNRAGFSANTSVTVNIDKAAPNVTISSPTDGATVAVSPVTVSGTATDLLSGVASVICQSAPATLSGSNFSCSVPLVAGPNTITIQAADVAGNTAQSKITVNLVAVSITDFNPKSAPIGTLVNVTGNGFVPTPGAVPQLRLTKQGGGTITAVLSSFTNTSLAFVIPAGATTGPLSVTVNAQTANSALPLTVTPSSSFSLTVAPGAADLIQGQSVGYAVNLGGNFTQLAALGLSGVPAGVTASFKPQSITGGQTSILTLTAPPGQTLGTASLSLTASATVDGVALSQTAAAQVNIVAPTTSFLGRTVVDDPLETSIAGVTVTMLGKDGSGGTTGCTGLGVSDGAGNFILRNLPPSCIGRQLIAFDGTTATSPAGKYAGVNLVYTFVSGVTTVSPVLVHLPRIDNKETFLVQQNAAVDQTYAFASIPGLSLTVYRGTTFTMPNSTQPNPFPLVAVQVPVDRLPDAKPPVPTMLLVFIVAFQPANARASQPVAVYYPNTINTAPGSNMPLLTLDPTRGSMVPYGTGTVAPSGTQVVPDLDPAFPGHRYGIVNFDWHGQMPSPPPPDTQPSPNPDDRGQCEVTRGCNSSCCVGTTPGAGDPVNLATGLQTYRTTDLAISGGRGSIAVNRIYRSTTILSLTGGPFGVNTQHNYNHLISTDGAATPAQVTLINPDNSRVSFARQTDGTYTNSTVGSMLGARVQKNASGRWELRYKNGLLMEFQPDGALVSRQSAITDRNGNRTTIDRNPANISQVLRVTDPVGRSIEFSYNAQGRISALTDPIGRTVTYTYNADQTLASVTNPEGGVTRYEYEGSARMLRMFDARNVKMFENTYAGLRVGAQTAADGGVFRFYYTFVNALVTETSPILATTVVDPLGRPTTYRFDPLGNLVQAIQHDPNIVYAVGLPAQGDSKTFDRAPAGNKVRSAVGKAICASCGNPAAGDISFAFDTLGNMTSRTDALGTSVSIVYEPTFSLPTQVTDPLGNSSTSTYDSRGNLTTSRDPRGNVTTYAYDTLGQLTQVTDPLGNKTKFAYDSLGNLISVIDPLGNITQFRYDGVSRLVEVMDSLGRRSQTTYDRLDRVTSRTDAKGGLTRLAYDAVGNLLSVTDARGSVTSFTYDSMNRLLTRTDPLGKTDTRTYDFNGNLIRFVDRRGQTSNFTYDFLNRLLLESYQDGSTVTRTYDASSRLVQVNDSSGGVFTFVYDLAGRLTSSTTPLGTVQYARDALGRVTSRQVVGQSPVSYSYDAAGNLLSAALPQASTTFAYDQRNLPSGISRLNGVSSAFTFDPAARLLSIAHTRGATAIDAESYAYDGVGNRASHETSIGQPLITQPTVNQFNASNQMTLFGAVVNTFDANGNLTQEGSTTYTWDSRNRLKSITTAAGQTTNFTYDFAGNLIQQADSGTALNLTKQFVLDDITDVAYQAASDGTSYSVLAGRSIDSHLAVALSNGQVQYGLTDAINSTGAVVDQAGTLVSRLFYEPFGQTAPPGGAYPFQYTGRLPVSSSLYYYRARFYNSQTGRFISEDPLGSGNLYTYAGNSPVQAGDPLGLLTLFLGGGGSFITGLGPQGSAGAYINFDHGINAGFYGSAGGGGGFDVGAGATGGFVVGPLSNFQNLTYNASLNLPVLGGGSAIISPGGQIIGGSLNGTANLPFPGISIAGQYTWTYSLTDLIYDTLRQILGPLTNPQNFCRFQP
jgi:RHS repeat-associated protein